MLFAICEILSIILYSRRCNVAVLFCCSTSPWSGGSAVTSSLGPSMIVCFAVLGNYYGSPKSNYGMIWLNYSHTAQQVIKWLPINRSQIDTSGKMLLYSNISREGLFCFSWAMVVVVATYHLLWLFHLVAKALQWVIACRVIFYLNIYVVSMTSNLCCIFFIIFMHT